MITKEQAMSLAISFAALNDANEKDDVQKKAYWAERLLDLQRETGVKLQPEWALKHCMAVARQVDLSV